MANHRVWIGLSDKNHEGTFMWIDGVTATDGNTRWHPGEPNDAGSNEDCAELSKASEGEKHEANDDICSKALSALCEKPLDWF